MYFFYFYLFASIALGTFNIGPFSIRVYFTVAMILLLTIRWSERKRRRYLSPQSYMYVFYAYIIVNALALLLNGEYEEYGFTKIFLARFLNCVVTFYAFDHFVTTPQKLRQTIIFLLGVMSVNCFVTILQYLGNPIGRAIALMLITSEEVKNDIQAGQNFDTANMYGGDITIGIFNFTFINGNYIAIFGAIMLGLWTYCKNFVRKGALVGLLGLFVIACLATQSRTPFILLIFFILLLLFLKSKSQLSFYVILTIFIVFLTVLSSSVFESETYGRIFDSEKYDNDPRLRIWEWCIKFIKENLFLGGPVKYEKMYDMAPHNYFLNAFVNSGILGGLIATYLFIKVIGENAQNLFRKHTLLVRASTAGLLIYIADTLFHNASPISGDTMFFIVYSIMLKAKLMESDNREINSKLSINEKASNYSRSLRNRITGVPR